MTYDGLYEDWIVKTIMHMGVNGVFILHHVVKFIIFIPMRIQQALISLGSIISLIETSCSVELVYYANSFQMEDLFQTFYQYNFLSFTKT